MLELSPAEQAVYGRIYPLIREIEGELQAGVVLLLWVLLVRLLAGRGIPMSRLVDLLAEHYEDQVRFNSPTTH